MADENPQSLSVLTVNLLGVKEDLGGGTKVPWRQRYGRIASWMRDANNHPDIIALQEVWLRKRYFAMGLDPADYETLFALIGAIQNRTNAPYRIAYASSRYTAQRSGPLYFGRALLYNTRRVRNTTGTLLSAETPQPFDSTVLGVHVRASHPCTETREEDKPLCARRDGDGRHWASGYSMSDGSWDLGPAASSFELVSAPGEHTVIYNVHMDTDHLGAFSTVTDLLNTVEASWAKTPRLYPSIVLGDFNVQQPDLSTNQLSPSGTFADFRLAGQTGIDQEVIYVLVKKPEKCPSRLGSSLTFTEETLPTREKTAAGFCGTPEIAWSDHCSVLVTFGPGIHPKPPVVRVPDVRGLTWSAASNALRAAGLRPPPTIELIPNARVWRQAPAGGELVNPGTGVTLFLRP